jgi:signal peptidase I
VVEATLAAWAEAGRQSRVPIEGTSMWPVLQPGDVVVVSHGRSGIHVGDVLAYRSKERAIIVHRLLRRLPGSALQVAGDNRPLADPPLSPDRVLGRVMSVETAAGRFSLERPVARALGWLLARAFPFRNRRVLWRVVVWLRRLAAWILRP